MNRRHSKPAAIAAASFALVCAMACNGGDDKPVQDATVLTFGPASGATLAFGWSQDRGWHLAHIDGLSNIRMLATSQTTGRQSTGSGGTSFFSGSTGGSSSFSGSTGGSSTFNGSTGGAASFGGSLAGAGVFSGSTIVNGAACDLEGLCDFVALICNSPDAQCTGFDDATCRAAVHNPELTGELSAILEQDNLSGAFCAIVNFIGCVSHGVTSLDQIDAATAQQCAESSGLLNLIQQNQVQQNQFP